MHANPRTGSGREEAHVDLDTAMEKPDDVQNEFGTNDRGVSVAALTEDPNAKALTRKLLWKLDTRYAVDL